MSVVNPSYPEAYRSFRWADTLRALEWSPTGSVNLGRTIVDRHVGSHRPALRWFGKTGHRQTLTFETLSRLSERFAGWLRDRGVAQGDRVAGFLPRVPEMLVAMIGTWKVGGVYVPIFTGFGPDAIEYRVRHSGAKVLCTHWEYRASVPAPRENTVTVTVAGPQPLPEGDVSFQSTLDAESRPGSSTECRRDDPAVLLYTSGSTGPPKGVMIATNFLAAIHPYLVHALDLRTDDAFWATGDPGWGYGLVCYMGALAMGVPVICHEGSVTAAESCLERLRDDGVTNLATTPTLLRGVMALPAATLARYPVRVRCASSCGEPLNGEAVSFFQRQWGVTVMDHYGSSEFGLPIGNCNALAMDVKPGSMGLPLPGSTMAIVDDDGRETPAEVVGQIGMRPHPEGYYSLGYWRDEGRTRSLYRDGWMTIGDLGRRDADGYFWFEGRADDVIKSAGYRIGPFEVESAILRHPAVAEAAVVGKPDPLRGHIVKAFVVLKPGHDPGPGLTDEIVDVVKSRVGSHQYPREIEFLDQLPKTETGKIQRFLLRTL